MPFVERVVEQTTTIGRSTIRSNLRTHTDRVQPGDTVVEPTPRELQALASAYPAEFGDKLEAATAAAAAEKTSADVVITAAETQGRAKPRVILSRAAVLAVLGAGYLVAELSDEEQAELREQGAVEGYVELVVPGQFSGGHVDQLLQEIADNVAALPSATAAAIPVIDVRVIDPVEGVRFSELAWPEAVEKVETSEDRALLDVFFRAENARDRPRASVLRALALKGFHVEPAGDQGNAEG